MSDSRAVRIALWALLVVSPLVSVLIIGAATGTSLFALDAWNTDWNDEQGYYHTLKQMHEVGEPSGVTGYNEVPPANPSYGPYISAVYTPYFVGSFITGHDSHNYVYLLNMAFGIMACLLIVLILRPGPREAGLCIAVFSLNFIVARYLCSGMTEGSYVLFAALFASCAIFAARHSEGDARTGLVVAAFAGMVLSTGFWGLMRPFLLAFMVVVWLMLAFADFGLGKAKRIIIAVLGLVVVIAAIAAFLHYSKYYATPFFNRTSIATGFLDRIGGILPELAGKHVESILYAGAKFVKLDWLGIMAFAFAAGWVILLVMSIRSLRSGDRAQGVLFLALVLAGIAIFEAHLLVFNYFHQMHRTMIPTVLIYTITIIWFAPKLARGNHGAVRTSIVPIALVAIVSVLCIGSLAMRQGEFALPQVQADRTQAASAALQSDLEAAIPRSADGWDNTIAHPIENNDIYLYFNIPAYTSTNTLQAGYLKKAIKNNSFKSKYVSLPESDKNNDAMAKRYDTVFQGYGHIIYRVR